MRARDSERGGGGVKALVFVAITLYGIYAAVKVVTARSDDATILHEAEVKMKFAGINREEPKDIIYHLDRMAKEKDIPLKNGDIKVEDLGLEWHTSFAYDRDIRLIFWNYRYQVSFDKKVPKG